MNVKDYLEEVSFINDMEICGDVYNVYKSKFDNSYITHVGLEKDIKFLADREITQELTHGVGFSPKDGKWYGWSPHRAIYGFKIGSTCEKGDCHYVGSNIEEQELAAIKFWLDDDHLNVRSEGIVEIEGKQYFNIKWEYTNDIPNEKLRGTTSCVTRLVTESGKGEWTAKTMDDAKQMAVDFNEKVS